MSVTSGRTEGGSRRRQGPDTWVRSPVRAALWSLLTLSIYGFWWWWDVNRRLRSLGQPADPWRALSLVTLGWLPVLAALLARAPWIAVVLSVIPVVLSVGAVFRTAAMLAAGQQAAGVTRPVSAPLAAGLAGVDALAVGVAWPLVAMGLVAYLQAGVNTALPAGSRAGERE
ncbi:DUF4234 domain-containing protein [Georgenia thermotolerans]|uniref:DUF4234 domain-containing protein n=1 Tax=Georgenia thermotolerans TaxID=527326 RepID=A0A7J5UKB5_9MICO|nr:DUF4234 domain-containing protein [Georgenia thermotolerans]KAE8762711.1 hypothetical protein GB883_17925 [Georgenia thermotolerans]